MTRDELNCLAAQLKHAKPTDLFGDGGVDFTARLHTWQNCVQAAYVACNATTPRFNGAKFRAACGVDDE